MLRQQIDQIASCADGPSRRHESPSGSHQLPSTVKETSCRGSVGYVCGWGTVRAIANRRGSLGRTSKSNWWLLSGSAGGVWTTA